MYSIQNADHYARMIIWHTTFMRPEIKLTYTRPSELVEIYLRITPGLPQI